MANGTIEAFRASDKRLRDINAKDPQFNGTWRVVPTGIQLDVSHGAAYISRIAPWFEFDTTKIEDVPALLEATERWCMAAIEYDPPADAG